MKKLSLITYLLSLITYASAQTTGASNTTSTVIHCTKFFVSKPMRELPEYKPAPGGIRREGDNRRSINAQTKSSTLHSANNATDPLIQTSPGTKTGAIAPIVNFEGMTDWYFDPSDPNGAVGDSLYVQIFNSAYAVYKKGSNNTRIMAVDLNNFWPDEMNGDPVVLFDKFANRWFISEFQDSAAPYKVCVGVSETSDPTGKYNVWEFSMGNTDPDYPKYSIWNDGYYLTFQGFTGFNLNSPQQVAVLDRSKMLKGNPNAGMMLAVLPAPPDELGGKNSLKSAPKTLDCDASALPSYDTPEYLVYFENIASGGYSDKIVMYKLVYDTGATPSFTVSRADSFAVPTFNAYFSGGSDNDITQPKCPLNHDSGVDALDGTFNFRVPFMVFPGYNSIVLSNTVNLGNSVAGIRWYELRQYSAASHWFVYDSGTYGPNDGVNRWNGAICMDYDGDIALEYCVSSPTVYPGIRYTGRMANDPKGLMTLAEQTAIAGNVFLDPTQNGVGHRWGDYSELDLDPTDGVTFWATNEYAHDTNSHRYYTQFQRIFSFKFFGNVLGIDEVGTIPEPSMKVYQQGNYLQVSASNIPTDDNLLLDLFDVRGRQLSSQSVVPQAGQFQAKINVSSYAKGIYFVRISRVNFQRVVKVAVE